MSSCNYARKIDSGCYEYGHMKITDAGTKKEERHYVPLGTCPTLEAALQANAMAPRGEPRRGGSLQPLSMTAASVFSPTRFRILPPVFDAAAA